MDNQNTRSFSQYAPNRNNSVYCKLELLVISADQKTLVYCMDQTIPTLACFADLRRVLIVELHMCRI